MSKLLERMSTVKDLPEITLGTLVESLEDDSLLVICLISILPFMQPIPIPGLSSLLGFVAMLQGIALMTIGRALLTKRMKSVVISKERFEMIYQAAIKFTKYSSKLSFWSHPKTNSKIVHIICGISITLAAGFLSLPLPIPFSNFIPAISIAFICFGLLEDDVLLILMGLLITSGVIWMGIFSYHIILEQFPSLMSILQR